MSSGVLRSVRRRHHCGRVYAFLAIIGVFVRLMGKTGTRKHIFLYETVIILGGVLGNILDIYEFPIYMGPYLGTLFICAYGLSVGIFVGCLVMSLAETLKAFRLSAGGFIWPWGFNI